MVPLPPIRANHWMAFIAVKMAPHMLRKRRWFPRSFMWTPSARSTVLWTFQRPLCLQKEMGSGSLHAASKNLLIASTQRVPSSTVECRQRARRTTWEMTTCRTPCLNSYFVNIKMPMACCCWAGKEPTCKMTSCYRPPCIVLSLGGVRRTTYREECFCFFASRRPALPVRTL